MGSNICENSQRRICSKSDSIHLNIIMLLLVLSTYVEGSTLDDDTCAVRFYAVKHFQGSYWTFDGNLWKYEENGHKYTENSGIPDRNIFVAKSIQTLANSPQECKGWKICWIVEKYWKQTWCKILSSAQNRYPDITNWQIGRLRMKQWSVNVINQRTGYVCIGKKCNDNTSGKFV